MPVVVRVLGPLEVICDGAQIVIHGGKERALLVRLALQAGRAVPVGALVEALWDGEPPASAEASLRVLVSRVRKTLAAAGTVHAIGTSSQGYFLAADDVDVVRFETLSARGRAELADGRPVPAAATLAEAVALWRGERLAEVTSARLQAEADRLEDARLSAVEARIDADLACGRHGDVLGELGALCRGHPLREHLWAKWITALYRCDRQAEALAAYQTLRQTLATELGIDPSPALRRLEAAVLAQSPALAPPVTAVPDNAVSIPAQVDTAERVPLVGRDAELRALTSAWAAARDGSSRTALVSGDAGIGKSRLLRELARSVRRHGATVLRGRCAEDLAVPFQPFVDVLSCLGTPVELEQRQLAELVRMVPALADGRPELPPPRAATPDVERYRLFTAVAALLTAQARQAPVLLILDDLHWADRPTMALMRHLAGLDLGRVLVVGAHRDSEQPHGPLVEMLGALRRENAVIRVALSGVAEHCAVDLMATTAGQEPDEIAAELARLLHRETSGNPFYLTEMLRHLMETGVITRGPDGRCTAGEVTAAGLPDSIREVLRARLARLGAEATRALSAAAVIGQEFDVGLLAHTTGLDDDLVLDILDTAGRTALTAEVTQRAGRFRFAHALVQHTLYADIGSTRRARLHARVAAAMETMGGHEPGELAHHYLAGVTADTAERAIHHAREAARRALATSAPDEAVRWYSAVLAALPPPANDSEHARALIDLGVAQRQAGHTAHRDTLFAAAGAARRAGAENLLVEAALANYRGGFSRLGQVDTEKVALLRTALEVAAPDTPERARLLATLAGELAWHPDHHQRIVLADEAVAVARRTGDPAALLYAITRPVPTDWVPERSEHRLHLYREAVQLAEQTNDTTAWYQAIHTLAQALTERASDDRLDTALDTAADLTTEFREPFMRWVSLIIRSGLAIVRGDLDRAEMQAAEALRIGRDGGLPDAQAGYEQQLGIIRWHQGRLAEVLPPLRTALAQQPGDPIRWAGLVLAEAVCGDRDRARTLLREAADTGFDLLYGASWLGCMCQWALIAAELDDRDAAAVLYTRLTAWEDLFGTSGPLPVHGVSHCLGRLAVLLGDIDAADRHFADALHTHHHMRAPFYIAETGLHWGLSLVDRDPERARSLLAHALELAQRHGFGGVERRLMMVTPG